MLAKPLPPLEAVLGEGAAADEAAIKEHNERGTAATREALSKIKVGGCGWMCCSQPGIC